MPYLSGTGVVPLLVFRPVCPVPNNNSQQQLLTESQVDHSAEADDGASQAEERFVKIVADLPADA